MDLSIITAHGGPDGEPLAVGKRYFARAVSISPQYILVCDAADSSAWHCDVAIDGTVLFSTPGEGSSDASMAAAEALLKGRVVAALSA